MKNSILTLLFALCGLSVMYGQESEYEKFENLEIQIKTAITKKGNIEERYRLVAELSTYTPEWYQNHFHTYPTSWKFLYQNQNLYKARLLKGSNAPSDIIKAINYYNDYFENFMPYENSSLTFPNDSHLGSVKIELSQLYLSKFLYFCISKQINQEPSVASSQAAKIFNDYSSSFGQFEDNVESYFILKLDSIEVQNYNEETYKTMLTINNNQNAEVMNAIGIAIENRNFKKSAKYWYKQAENCAGDYAKKDFRAQKKANEERIKRNANAYGAFDYRLHGGSTFKEGEGPKSYYPTAEETNSYNQWWEKTYGKGGTQNNTTIQNNNIPQATFKPSQSEDERHRNEMDKIQRERERQQNKDYKKANGGN